MSKIFISHSNENNAAALAVAKWLADSGWEEYFLDITPSRGLAPGERWQEALKFAADRCEAVLFLISPSWQASRWCLAEFLLAKQLGKAIFGVLVEATPLDALPREMTTELQLCDLVTGAARCSFRVSQEPIVPETDVSFAEDGLLRLRVGLQRAGLDPARFPWPPHGDPNRAPYRGLNALEPEDAAVFFGREAAIVRGLDALRGSRERGVERLFVILGASGAGKSSFLRAGLWPRLIRDDRNFLPLPVMRPERAVISGTTGLAASIEAAFRERKTARSRAVINNALREPDGFNRLLAELQTLATSRIGPDASSPTVVIPIDQGEELFGADGGAEAERFLDLIALMLSRPEGGGAAALAARQRALAIVAIRSDSYERLQTEPRLAQVAPYLFSLPPIARAEFKAIVEGPAKRRTEAGHKLVVDPALTERLVNDAEGADALPLLAFTLERLFVEHGGDGKLLLEDYEVLGGVRGSIEAAVEMAFAEPGREPAVPADKAVRERLLRASFIPWLARVDPDTEERKRRVARWEEIPPEARPLIERLIERRLLVRDRRKIEGRAEDVVVVEVAHEALLRQWPTLTVWLDEDLHALKILDAVQRAAAEWAKNREEASSGEAWLVHTGERLVAAEAVRRRSDFERLLGPDGRAYLEACRARDERVRQEKEELAEREALAERKRSEAEAKTARRTRIAAYVIAFVAAIAVGAAFFGWRQAIVAKKERNQALASVSREQTDKGQATLGMLLALEALPKQAGKDRQFASGAEAALLYALFAQREKHVLPGHTEGVNKVRFSPQGTLVVTASRDHTARLWNTATGKLMVTLQGHASQVYSAEFSPDGKRVVTASSDKTARIWDVETEKTAVTLQGHEGDVYQASFSSDGKRVVTASSDKTARIWDAETGKTTVTLTGHDGQVFAAEFSPDGQQVVTSSDDGTARVWRLSQMALEGRPRVLHGHKRLVTHAAFSSDGTRIITASWDQTARLWNGLTGENIATLRGHQDGVSRAAFSPDGKLIVTTSADSTARLWDGITGRPVAVMKGHKGQVHDAQFSPDGRWLVTAADDGTARLWDVATHETIDIFGGHAGRVWSARFSPDGQRLATTSE
ncbi:MAG: beta-propeller domain-containing protein, partial [Burkholderiales bacterium]